MENYLLIIVLSVCACTSADRTFTKVYQPIEDTAACFKRLNGTDEIGCRSSSNGDVGVLHLVEDQLSLQWVLSEGPHAPYIVLVNYSHFTSSNLLAFKSAPSRVSGVLLLSSPLNSSFLPPPFSPDSSCPNHQFSYYNSSSFNYCPAWNPSPSGNDLLFQNFPFPIFLVKNATEVETLVKCYEDFNRPTEVATGAPSSVSSTLEPRSWPLCAGQLKSFMLAAKDTPTCMRRSNIFNISPASAKVCDPLGDQNLVATLPLSKSSPSTPNDNSTASALVIAARIDGASLFDEISPSADSSVTGLVTLLSILKHLSNVPLTPSPSSTISSIHFVLLHGEAFGYIGSSRLAYDMANSNSPFPFSSISHFLELSQLNPSKSNPPSYYLHQTPLSQSNQFMNFLQTAFSSQNLSLSIIPNNPFSSPSSWGLPPSSLHSVLKEYPSLPGLLLTNHKTSYTNPYFNSLHDTPIALPYTYNSTSPSSLKNRLASVSAAISNAIISLLNPSSPPSPITSDPSFIDELLNCYLITSNCSVFNDLSGSKHPPSIHSVPPYPLYVGVSAYTNTLTQLTKYLMVTYLGETIDNITSDKDCFKDATSPNSTPRYFLNGTCYETNLVNSSDAKSPAFIIPDYDWTSGRYSTWTESVWQKFSVRIFLKPSLLHELLTLFGGIVVLVVSMVGVHFVDKKKHLIFPPTRYSYEGYMVVPSSEDC